MPNEQGWLERNYRGLMLGAMALELILLTLIAVVEVATWLAH